MCPWLNAISFLPVIVLLLLREPDGRQRHSHSSKYKKSSYLGTKCIRKRNNLRTGKLEKQIFKGDLRALNCLILGNNSSTES